MSIRTCDMAFHMRRGLFFVYMAFLGVGVFLFFVLMSVVGAVGLVVHCFHRHHALC